MKCIFTNLFLILIGVSSISWVLWRLLSYRYVLPCPTWLGWLVEMDNPFSKINRAENIIRYLEIQPGMSVVDVGCGPGRVTIPVARKVGPTGEVVAMDIQSGMLDRTQEKAEAEYLANITFLQAGVGEQKLEHNKFDRALLVTVLGEIPDQRAALKEIYNALKPGGILSVTEIFFDPHYQRRDSVIQLAREVGFLQRNLFEDWCAYTLHLEKPIS